MAELNAGPCSAWEPVACGAWPEDLESVRDYALMAATEVLWERTKRRFGLCEVTLRPCRKSCAPYGALSWLGGWLPSSGGSGGWGWPYPALLGGRWYNLGCGVCENECSCTQLYQIELPTPVAAILEVKIDGAVFDPVNYRVDNWKWLLRLDGQDWPLCQDLNKTDDEEDTWSVTATYGEAVPMLGLFAVNELALQIAKTCSTQTCGTSSAVTKQIVRQGITKVFEAGFGELTNRFLNTYNPTNSGVATVFNIDKPAMRRLTFVPPQPHFVTLGLVEGSGLVFTNTPTVPPPPQTVVLGLVAGSGTAFSVLPDTTPDLGLVTGTGTVLSLGVRKTVVLGLVNETDLAIQIPDNVYYLQPLVWWASDTATNTDVFPPGQGFPSPYSINTFSTNVDANIKFIQQWFWDTIQEIGGGGWTFDFAPTVHYQSSMTAAQLAANNSYNGYNFFINGVADADAVLPEIDLTNPNILTFLAAPIHAPSAGPDPDTGAAQCFGMGAPEGFTRFIAPCHPPFMACLWGESQTYPPYGSYIGSQRDTFVGTVNTDSVRIIAAHEIAHAIGYNPTTDSLLPHANPADTLNLMISTILYNSLASAQLDTTQKNLIKASPFVTLHMTRPV